MQTHYQIQLLLQELFSAVTRERNIYSRADSTIYRKLRSRFIRQPVDTRFRRGNPPGSGQEGSAENKKVQERTQSAIGLAAQRRSVNADGSASQWTVPGRATLFDN